MSYFLSIICLGIPYPHGYPPELIVREPKREPVLPPALFALTKGESDLLIASINANLKPIQYFLFDPSDPVEA